MKEVIRPDGYVFYCVFFGIVIYFIYTLIVKLRLLFDKNHFYVLESTNSKSRSYHQFRIPIGKEIYVMLVSIVTNEEECNNAVHHIWNEIKDSALPALGFDCEWISQPKMKDQPVTQPISLLQLCTPNGFCFLFRLNRLQCLPESLKSLLTTNILFLGVNCRLDAALIKQNYGLKLQNYFDLRYLYKKQGSLANLAFSTLGITLDKTLSVVCSNWNAENLSEKQIEYAAKDAWVAIEMFKYWSACKLEDEIMTTIEKYQNTDFKLEKYAPEGIQIGKGNSFHSLSSQKFARKSPLYDNCWMYAPDGQQLCSCDRRKAEWYIQKGLAVVISYDPFSIKLLFEPNSRPDIDPDGDFYRQFKKNCCVVCGSKGPCMKHYVIPKEYRKYFPIYMKSHQSHDIVLTCLNCHGKSKRCMNELKEKLAKQCDAPTYVMKSSHLEQLRKMKSFCKTLIHSGENIPIKKRRELEETVKDYFGLTEINSKVLQEILLSWKINEEKFLSHGEKVVEYYKKLDGGLMELEILWRKQFLENLKPQFLPTAWSVNHGHKKIM